MRWDAKAYERHFLNALVQKVDESIIVLASNDPAALRLGVERFGNRLRSIFRQVAGTRLEIRVADSLAEPKA